jgi:hypothetical protein
MDIFNREPLLLTLAREPEDSESFNYWVQQQDIFPFLENEILDEHIILYASLPYVLIYAVLIPDEELDDSSIQDLLGWEHFPYSSWSEVSSSDEIWIEPPLSDSGSELLSQGEQIIFMRSFAGYHSQDKYYEISQKITHVLDIHFMPERNAWCRLDRLGDIEDVIKIVSIDNFGKNETGIVITMQRKLLGHYANLTDSKLIRMFDFTRMSKIFYGWQGEHKISYEESNNIFSRLVVYSNYASYSRGFQLVDVSSLVKDLDKELLGNIFDNTEKKYETYVAHDWKNNAIQEISCNPSCLANYFTESDLPFQITPAFFKPEVLLKYKTDREKYQLDSNSVSCRDTWHLENFDINEAGQIHTYLIYLSHLPYEEQLHWKQYNEKPKAPLSERVIKRDFEGQFYQQYDPLSSLKYKLDKLDSLNVKWWKLRDRDAIKKVHYPYTTSKDEWAEEILNLDQLVVEGFEKKWLKARAKILGRSLEENFGSIKIIEECLISFNFEEEEARQIISSFREIHHLRSKVKGHTNGQEADILRKTALQKFGSFRKHFEHLCAECDESLDVLINAFKDFD